MIRKLRFRLILASMLSLFLVLALIIGVGTGLSYKNLIDEADDTLSLIADSGGIFTPPAPGEGREPPERSARDDGVRPGREQSPEFIYETRYFSVTLDGFDTVTSIDLDRIYSVDSEGAAAYALKAIALKSERGFVDQYRFYVRRLDSGSTVYFLNCWQNLRALRRFFAASSLAALLGMAAVLVLITFFSSRIVRPIAASYDKQRRFVTDAGHDLKTPLAIIRADTEVLGMDLGGNNEWLNDIAAQTMRLTALTDELITLSRMDETEGEKLSTETLSLSELLRENLRPFKNMALSEGLGFKEEISDGVSIAGNKRMIERLVGIIMDNALKYCTPGGEIGVSLSLTGSKAVLLVTNHAEGIREEDLKHLFDRFYRADTSRNSSSGGYGLGLSIANSIVSKHRGRISASMPSDGIIAISVTFPALS